jgi:hypothetical protein
MTSTAMASHTGRSKLIDQDPIASEVLHARQKVEREDRAFIIQLRAALLCGLETPSGVLGHEHGPRCRS